MAKIGQMNTLTVVETSPHGLYLDGGEDGNILLPNRYVGTEMKVGRKLAVFIYLDSEDRLVATTEKPLAQVGDIASLKVVTVHPRMGAFLDWGLPKELLLPFREQGTHTYRPGDQAIVAIYVDQVSRRVVASTRLGRHFWADVPSYQPNDPVEVLIYGVSPLGFKAVVDGHYEGLLFHAETAEPLRPGDRFTGYIKEVHRDGKIDLLRDPAGYGRVEGVTQVILRELEAAGGRLPFNDRSPPESIRQTFNTSKKAFKQALGALLKQGRISFTEEGIALTSKS